jgi:hypothetical protein
VCTESYVIDSVKILFVISEIERPESVHHLALLLPVPLFARSHSIRGNVHFEKIGVRIGSIIGENHRISRGSSFY